MKLVLLIVAVLFSALANAQSVTDGVVTDVCSGAVMTLNPAYTTNSCTVTQAITSIALPAGTGGGRPFLLIIKNPSNFAISGWPSTASTPSPMLPGTNYLRGVWDPTSGTLGQWVFLSVQNQLFYGSGGLIVSGKCWLGTATSNTSGVATVNYTSAGFTAAPLVFVQPLATGAAANQQYWANPVTGNTATSATIAVTSPATVVVANLAIQLASVAIAMNVMACGN